MYALRSLPGVAGQAGKVRIKLGGSWNRCQSYELCENRICKVLQTNRDYVRAA